MEKAKLSVNQIVLYLGLGIILVIASYLRLNNIRNYMVFLGDQGRDVLTVLHIIKNGDLVFIGPTASVGGFFLGPFYYYLMVPALMLSRFDPVGPAIMVALFSIVTTYLCYYFAKKYLNVWAGIIAAALFAVSRLVVEYARSSWNPNVLPFFSMVLLLSLAKILENKTRRKLMWMFCIGACMGIIIQLHYQAVVMNVLALVVYGLYVWRETKANSRVYFAERLKELIAIVAGVAIFLGPFIAFEIYHSFPNTQNIYRFVFENRGDGFKGGQSYEFIVRDTIYRLFLRLVAGGNDNAAQIAILVTASGYILAAYIVVSRFYDYILQSTDVKSFNRTVGTFILSISYKPKFIGYSLLILYFLIGVGFWGFYKKSIYDYYYSYMYPLPILLVAGSISLLIFYRSRRLKEWSRKGVQTVFGTSLLIYLVSLLYLNYQSINQMAEGMQVYRTEEVAKAIVKHKTEGKYNFALITPGNSDHAYRYFLEVWNQRPTPLEEEVTKQLMVFCEVNEPKPCEPEGNSLWEVAGFGRAGIVGQWQVIGLPLYRLEHLEESKDLEGKPAKKDNMYLSVVIPCYNEETNIRNGVLHVVSEYLEKQQYVKEVIIVDDGSEDESRELIEKYIQSGNKSYMRLIKNQHGGKAATVITGMLAGEGDIILFTDMDQATPLEEVEKLLPYFEQGYDIVFGSRAGERKGAPIVRRAMSRGFMILRTIILGLNGIRDTQCGFKAFKKDVGKSVFSKLKIHSQGQNIKGSTVTASFDVEMLFVAKTLGYKIKEVPVQWHYVGTKRVNALKESYRALRDMLILRANALKGLYK